MRHSKKKNTAIRMKIMNADQKKSNMVSKKIIQRAVCSYYLLALVRAS